MSITSLNKAQSLKIKDLLQLKVPSEDDVEKEIYDNLKPFFLKKSSPNYFSTKGIFSNLQEELRLCSIYDYNIIKSIFSSIGNFSKHEELSYPNLNLIFRNIMIILKYNENKYKTQNKICFPTAKDALLIDSKLDYMRMLLNNNLCNPLTVIFYIDDNGKHILDKKSQDNLKYLYSNTNDVNYFIKTPFSGNSNCSKSIKHSILFKNFQGDNFDQIITNIKEFFKNYCIGSNFGFIIQPENDNFGFDYREKKNTTETKTETETKLDPKFGEIRCFCYKGEIKLILIDRYPRGGYFNFIVVGVHKSVYKQKIIKELKSDTEYENKNFLGKSEDDYKSKISIFKDSNLVDKLNNYTDENSFLYTSYLSDENNKVLQKIIPELKKKCLETYTLLKIQLDIDGFHHRIDLINKKDDPKNFEVNEIENINYGNMANMSLFGIEMSCTKMNSSLTLDEKNFLNFELFKFDQSSTMQVLLSFDQEIELYPKNKVPTTSGVKKKSIRITTLKIEQKKSSKKKKYSKKKKPVRKKN